LKHNIPHFDPPSIGRNDIKREKPQNVFRVRLHRSRRRIGRLRAGQPAVGKPRTSVLLLEAGGEDWNPWIHIPVGYFKTMHDPKLDWCYVTEPDPGIANRQLQWPRGKVLGGSSSLNGLLYIRGQREDYDHWAARATGLELCRCAALLHEVRRPAARGRCLSRRRRPQKVSDLRLNRPIADHFVKAAQEIGIPFNDDPNGAEAGRRQLFPADRPQGLALEHRQGLPQARRAVVRT
jgi:choline dehydrogenase-like flavoprotein